jgi:hypothetical protein
MNESAPVGKKYFKVMTNPLILAYDWKGEI